MFFWNWNHFFQSFEKLIYFALLWKPLEWVDSLTSENCKYCWYWGNFELACNLSAFINVYFQKFDFSLSFLDSFLKNWSQLFARSTPICIKVNDHRFSSISNNHWPILRFLQLNDIVHIVFIEFFAFSFQLLVWIIGFLLRKFILGCFHKTMIRAKGGLSDKFVLMFKYHVLQKKSILNWTYKWSDAFPDHSFKINY